MITENNKPSKYINISLEIESGKCLIDLCDDRVSPNPISPAELFDILIKRQGGIVTTKG